MINKKSFLIMFFIFGIFILPSFVLAYTQSYYSSVNNNVMGLGGFSGGTSLTADESMCQQGTDFLIQVGPMSCTPTLVRSDLLEEENVNVFCQLTATQINPFIDVKNIKWLTFKGQTPKEVLSLGYQPAQAALGYTSATGLQGSALLNNLGYVVVQLKQQPNESALTNCKKDVLGSDICWVEGNLTATLTYDVQSAFGIGQAVFYLPVMDDTDWQQNYVQYSFWGGRGFLRANAVGDSDATVSVYSDSSVASGLSRSNREYNLEAYTSNIKIASGATSDKIFLPGLSSCLASLKLTLNGIENPNTRASLKINDDYVEVAEGENFLDNKCTLVSIDKTGIKSGVTIKCSGADDSSQRSPFNLRIFPKVNLSIDGKIKSYSVGDWLYNSQDKAKSVYLGYVGTVGDTTNTPKDLYVYLVALPVTENSLTDSEISSVVAHAESIRASSTTGAKTFDSIVESLKKISGATMQLGQYLIKGESFYFVPYSSTSAVTNAEGVSVLLKGLSNPEDNSVLITNTANSGVQDYLNNYQKAMSDFETVVNSFPKEVESANSVQTLGEKALYEEIVLANSVKNKKTVADLCTKFEQDYPDTYENVDLCKYSLQLSNSEEAGKEITINGITKIIYFEGIKEPSLNDYSATVLVQGPNGKEQSFDLRKNQQVPLDGFRTDADKQKLQTGEYLMLTDLGTNTASIKLSLGDQNFFQAQFVSDTETFTKGISIKKPAGNNQFYTFTVTKINLQKVAKVTIVPSTDFSQSNTTFQFKIGIEKRAIQLSPAQTKERITSLNSSIAEWKKASDALYTVVKTMKATCVGAGAVLTFKNLIDNYGGKAIARQKVMTGAGGWDEKCAAISGEGKQYKSIDACFLANSDSIDADVNKLFSIMDNQNQEIKQIENANVQGTGTSAQINTAGVAKDYSAKVMTTLNSLPDSTKAALKTSDIATILTPDGWTNNKYTIDQLKEIELYSLDLKSNPGDTTAMQRLSSVLTDINNNAKSFVEQSTFKTETGMGENVLVDSFDKLVKMKEIQVTDRIQFKDTKYASLKIETLPGVTLNTADYAYAIKDSSTGKKYVVLYDTDGVVTQTYEIVSVSGVESLNLYKDDKGAVKKNPFDLVFKKYDSTSYKNTYKSSYGSSTVLLRYYEDSPYKGFPSVVPFDLTNGWYAGVKSPQTSYTAAGVINSFWVCNVGKNGIEEFQLEGFGDDTCELFNTNTGQKYTQFPGLSSDETSSLVTKANNAIQTAQKAYKEGATSVTINGKKIKVGEPTVQSPATQCTDFMSPKDCSLLFNLCDPVICPSSRCNLGGNYPVKDVIQSGIIGSIALCYPNAKWNGGDVYVPVCLSGIQAGMDSWVSVQQSYRDCLQKSLDTGETVGICDEINSIYTCEFFWKQAIPIIKAGLPKLLGIITGQNKKGGGEYQGISSALSAAKASVDYFKQYYAANSYKAFQARSTDQVGTEVCGTFASLVYPDSGSFLDNLITPDSPVQFTGKFDEISLTTATNPPTSQYKVYYYIYAGKDAGAYYQVYLRGTGSSYYQDTAQNRMVKSSYIEKGGYASDTVDFTAPSGYQQLCIAVNGQEECGFKEVSTSFAVNYLNDLYIAQQSTTNVTTETECISGTSSFYSLLNLNTENGANNYFNPALYTQGIIRICSTSDPGVGTDASAGTENARWKQMGYCGDKKIGCWIDTNSVKDVIKAMNIEQSTLSSISNTALTYLSSDYLSDDTFKAKLDAIKTETSDLNRIALIQDIFDKVFFNNQKAQLYFWRGKSYSNLAINYYESIVGIEEFPCRHFCGIDDKGNANVYYGQPDPTTGVCEKSNLIQKNCVKGCDSTYGACVEDLSLTNVVPPAGTTVSEFDRIYASPFLIFADGTLANNLCYRYYNTRWQWSAVCTGPSSTIAWHDVSNIVTDVASGNINPLPQKNQAFITSLQNQANSYFGGFKLLVDRTIVNNEGGISSPDLEDSTGTTTMNNNKIFEVTFSQAEYNRPTKNIYFNYTSNGWLWEIDESFGGSWKSISNFVTGTAAGLEDGQKTLLSSLKDKNFYEGAAILFDSTSTAIRGVSYNEATGTTTAITATCTSGQTKCDGTTYYTCVNNAWISQGLVDGKCGYTAPTGVCVAPSVLPGVSTISGANQKVLEAAKELEGALAYVGPSSCYSATMFVYQSAGLTFKCDYSDKSGKEYFLTAENNKKVTIGVDKNDKGDTLYVPNEAACTNVDFSYNQKINSIQPGDELDIVWNSGAGHSVIFISWNDKAKGDAKVFDWMGGILLKGQLDSKGNPCDDAHLSNGHCYTYAYHDISLTDTVHPIYLHRIPVV
jgi:hypothetical protein